MAVARFFEKLYERLSRRRGVLFAAALVLILASLAGLTRIEVQEDIEAMLPDGGSGVARDFRMLQKAPFARKVLVHLQAAPDVDTQTLLSGADRLAAVMKPPLVTRAVSGPQAMNEGGVLPWLLEALPNLTGEDDLQGVRQRLTPAAVEERLRRNYRRMLSPQGWALKEIVRRDPLELRNLALRKLRYVNPVEKTQLRDGHFASADGRHALIIAETPVAITDSRGGRRLLDRFSAMAAEALPPGVSAELVSGHPYTVANAETIKEDLVLVLAVSLVALLALFLVFLHDLRALFVFLVPVAVVGGAAVAVSLFYDTVSGITIGFGAVLLGVTVDFALHVYFALRSGPGLDGARLGRVARPVLFGGLTTLGAFAVLLLSDLPGQRQLAVFSMTGIGASLLLSLLVLPQLVGARQGRRAAERGLPAVHPPRSWTLVVWLVLLVLCGWQATQIGIDGDLRQMTTVPEEVRAAEENLQRTWGNMRGKAMLFARGATMQEALELNDRLFAYLREEGLDTGIVSISALQPAASTQEENRRRWASFWQNRRAKVESLLHEKGREVGFSRQAFAPFLDGLQREPEPVTSAAFAALGLEDLFDSLVFADEEQVRIVTLAPDTDRLRSLFGREPAVPGVALVSQTRFGDQVGRAIAGDFARFISLACVMVVALLTLLFRDWRKVALALLPVATGLVVMFGVMAMAGITFNLFNIVATILIIGLGVDYGIFMVCREFDGRDHGTERAVLVSGLTTLAGFGALALARHPALYSIGLTVLFGITPAVLSALWVIPALCRREGT